MNTYRVEYRAETVVTYDASGETIETETTLAVFPDAAERDGSVSVYARIGQHAYARPEYVDCLPFATPEQYADLHRELTAIYAPDTLEIINPETARRAA